MNSPRASWSHIETGCSVVFLPGAVVELEVVLETSVRRSVFPPGPLGGHVVGKETGTALLPAGTPGHGH